MVPTFDVKLTLEEAIHLAMVLGSTMSFTNEGTFSGLMHRLDEMGCAESSGLPSLDDSAVASRAKELADRYMKDNLNG